MYAGMLIHSNDLPATHDFKIRDIKMFLKFIFTWFKIFRTRY